MHPLLVKRGSQGQLEKLNHWNRRAWQELAILNTRLDQLEKAVKVDTGGEYEYAPEGDPWEKEIVVESHPRLVIGAFLLGIFVGIALTLALTWG